MKICMITMDFPPKARGAGQYAYKLAKGLRDRGHEVVVLTRGSSNVLYTLDNINDINVYRVRFVKAYPFHLELHKKFIEKLLREEIKDCDILHLHTPSVPAVQIGNVPIVSTFHGTAYGSSKRRGYRDIYSIGIKLSLPLFINTERKIILNSKKIIAATVIVKNELEQYYLSRNSVKITIIPNAVDTNKFTPTSIREDNKKIIDILYVGGLEFLKGILDLLHTLNILQKNGYTIKATLIGDGPLKHKVLSLLYKSNLYKNTKLTGFIDNNDLVTYYRRSKLVVLPSYYEGGRPGVLLEAMACGVPVVATRVGGIPELIKDDKTGLLVPPKDPKALAEAIIYLLDNEKERKKLGKNGRKLIEKNYSIDQMTKKYLDIYKEVQK